MYKYLLPLVAVGLSACGGSSTTDPNNIITNLNPGDSLDNEVTQTDTGGNPVAATLAQSFTRAGSAYTVSTGGASIALERTNTSASHLATYKLTLNGTEYTLSPAVGNSASKNDNSFRDSSGNVALFLNENTAYASIANIQISSGGSNTEQFAALGNATALAALPTTSAAYSGIGEISIDRASGAFDDAPNSTVSFTADFANGTIIGAFSVVDGAGDSAGGVDIVGGYQLPFNGTLNGNTFSGTVDYSNLVANTAGLDAVTINSAIDGAFFGQNAENATGVGLSVGQSTASSGNDTLIYTRIQADKQ